MRRCAVNALLLMLVCLACSTRAFAQSTHLLVIVGLAGTPEHGELFKKWGTTLADTASQKLGVDKANVTLLADAAATRDGVTKAFDALAATAGAEDTVVIVLFGHGTFAASVAKFNLTGPDMAPQDFAPLLAKLKSKRVVFVNTASASGPFVEGLSGPGRVIVAATRTGDEKYATLFGGPFVDAFFTEAADADRDGRVSILEAFEFAKNRVAASYEKGGHLLTEHATLDDGSEGKFASTQYLAPPRSRSAEMAKADPKLRALVEERDALDREVAALRLKKNQMNEAEYQQQLEKLVTDLALKDRAIRELEAKK